MKKRSEAIGGLKIIGNLLPLLYIATEEEEVTFSGSVPSHFVGRKWLGD